MEVANILKNSYSVLVSSYSVFISCCPLSRNGWIHPIPSAIACTPSLHFAQFRASFFFKLIFSVLSSRSSSVILAFSCHLLQDPEQPSKLSSLLSTCPYHLTPFVVANWSIVSLNPHKSICSSVVFFCQQLSDRTWLSP